MIIKKISLLLSIVLLTWGCTQKGPEPRPDNLVPFSPELKSKADKIISCFENSTTAIQYSYIENLDDGRGYTAGRAGFTTGTGDLLIVIKLYTDSIPNNELSQFLPKLLTYAEEESDNTLGLESFSEIWKNACNNPIFISCQDYVSDSLYYYPAVKWANDMNIKYPLTLLAIYDAIIQHGEGEDPDGLPALLESTNKKCGGTPKQGIKEWKWLETFLDVRKNCLQNPYNKSTKEEWRESVDRVKVLDKLRKEGNFLIEGRFTIEVYGDSFIIE